MVHVKHFIDKVTFVPEYIVDAVFAHIFLTKKNNLNLLSIYYNGLLQFPENAGKYWQRMFIWG